MKTREELLEELVRVEAAGNSSHTDAVNWLASLLDEEADEEPDAPWVKKLHESREQFR